MADCRGHDHVILQRRNSTYLDNRWSRFFFEIDRISHCSSFSMEIPASKLTSDIKSGISAMASNTNSNQMKMDQHPLEAIATGIASATSGERRGNRVSHMMSANEGPADIIGKVSGAVNGGKRADDGLYFTNNEGIPFPDPWVSDCAE
jgi:hypothetical protein